MAVLLMIAQVPARIVEQGIDWPAWTSAGAAVATLVIVAVTAWFARNQLKDAASTRHAQLATELFRHWTEPDAVEARALYGSGREYSAHDIADLVTKLFGPPGDTPPTDKERADWRKLSLWANDVEFLGMLASQKWITPKVIYEMWGGGIQTAWKAWEPAVYRLRDYDDEPDTYQHFEEIAREMQAIGRLRESGRRAASASARDPQAGAGAVPQRNDRTQSTAAPPSSAPNSSSSTARWPWGLLVALLALSAFFRWLTTTKRG